MTARDLVYVARARRRGSRYPFRIVKAARKVALDLAIAFALVEQESSGFNIFGHDGTASYQHPGQPVTRARVIDLIRHVHAGGTSNGVGLTQLTDISYLELAERQGGAQRPYIQCLVGFQGIRDLIRAHGTHGGMVAYNGSGAKAEYYAVELERRVKRWRSVLKY